MKSWLFPQRHCWRRFRWSSPLDECVQLRCVHFIHQLLWLNHRGQYRFLQMRMKDQFSCRSSLDLQFLIPLDSAISLGNLCLFLDWVHLRLSTAEPHACPSDLQFL